MKEGFYFYRKKVFYGRYDETQVSGQGRVSAIRPELIQSEHPVCEDDQAVRLWENHRMLEPEYTDLQAILLKIRPLVNLNTEQAVDFSAIEEKLNCPFPEELKLIYTAIHHQEEYFSAPEHFLPLDEIYVEQGILVFFKKKRAPVAGYEIGTGRLAQYYKREWHVENGGFCCYQFCAGRILTIALENKPVFRQGRCKGKFVTALDIERELECFCDDRYHLLPELNVYGIAVMYSEEALIAWIRSNGFYADIHAGALEESHLDALGEHLGQIAWQKK